ncbi:hypothetical protein IJ596_00830 [bacterium]|nr:hypothetical protein [bacterium]
MYISKMNALNFAGNIRVTTKPDCTMVSYDVSKVEHLRPSSTNDEGRYSGCVFEADGKKYTTCDPTLFLTYMNLKRKAENTDVTITLPGLFEVDDIPELHPVDDSKVPHPGNSPIATLPADYPEHV